MSIDALAHNVFELHNAIQCQEIGAVDQKVQQIIKQYDLLKPGSHDIEALYQKEKLDSQLNTGKPSEELMRNLRKFEWAVVNKISEAAPSLDLKQRIHRQERFAEVCTRAEVLRGDDLQALEKILKEGPVDVSAIVIPRDRIEYRAKGHVSLLTFVMQNWMRNNKVLLFLLEHGATFNPIDKEEATAVMDYLLPKNITTPVRYNNELFETLLKSGLDINVVIPKVKKKPSTEPGVIELPDENDTTLLYRAQNGEYIRNSGFSEMLHPERDYTEIIRNLIFYGAGDINDEALLNHAMDKVGTSEILVESFRIREDMLEKMQKHLHPKERKPYKELSVSERLHLANLCRDAYKLRFNFSRLFYNGRTPDKDLEARMGLHLQFLNACLKGDFEAAEKLLLQDIDINAYLLPHPTISQRSWPLLNNACSEGDAKLVEFLLKHGAKCNIGDDKHEMAWLPPLLDCAVNNTRNYTEIRELLLKAGAHPNDKSGTRYWVASPTFHQKFVYDCKDQRGVLENLILSGWNIDIPYRSGKEIFDTYKSTFLDGGISLMQNPNCKKEYVEVSKLLIFYGARIRDEDRKTIQAEEICKPLRDALEIRDRALNELLNEHLKEIEDLKPLSMDLINLVGGYVPDVQWTPQLRVELAKRCFKIKDEG